MPASEPKRSAEPENLGLLMHVPLDLTVELGRAKLSVAEILKLGTGSIIELDRAAGAPVELLVNDRPIARGEIVAVDESFGLRITELLAVRADAVNVETLLGSSSRHAGDPLNVLIALTLLSLVPLLLVMCTSFVRIVVVLSLVRSAIGASALPPNAVLTGLALVLTLVVMAPTAQRIGRDAVEPYSRGRLSASQALDRAWRPLRAFMLRQTRAADVALFTRVARAAPVQPRHAPMTVLIPAFVVGELRSAFAIGFALYLPFVAIDLAVAAMLMGLGMMMLSPPVVSLPVKLLLFVMVDGWALLCGGVAGSFR